MPVSIIGLDCLGWVGEDEAKNHNQHGINFIT
jgi:hypothetical protein